MCLALGLGLLWHRITSKINHLACDLTAQGCLKASFYLVPGQKG